MDKKQVTQPKSESRTQKMNAASSVMAKVHELREGWRTEIMNATNLPHLHLWIFFFNLYLSFPWASLVAQMVNNLPAIEESQVWPLGWEDPLEKGMATHSSILAWEIPWTEEPGQLQSMGLQIVNSQWLSD